MTPAGLKKVRIPFLRQGSDFFVLFRSLLGRASAHASRIGPRKRIVPYILIQIHPAQIPDRIPAHEPPQRGS